MVARVRQDDRSYGYRVQSRYLIKMRDEGGNIYVWPARPRSADTLPQEGAQIQITATVHRHDTYRDTAQTYLTNCRWKPADQHA
ncbi:hypothetical protein GCM10010353_59270 [Streptomyces chryseus]|nr:hypothetical protein GCM10010353_59270 [Streptomyces chryseus]